MASSDLVSDLNIDGDDAEELFMELLNRKDLSLSVERLNQYFHTEEELLDGFYLLKLMLFKLRLRSKLPSRELDPFTVRDTMDRFITFAK